MRVDRVSASYGQTVPVMVPVRKDDPNSPRKEIYLKLNYTVEVIVEEPGEEVEAMRYAQEGARKAFEHEYKRFLSQAKPQPKTEEELVMSLLGAGEEETSHDE